MPLIASVLLKLVAPVPVIAPPVQAAGPLMFTAPVPLSVPLFIVNASRVDMPFSVSVPPFNRVAPVPVLV